MVRKARKRQIRRPQDPGAYRYGLELPLVFGRRLVAKDGYSEARILKAERRLGCALPRAMREFYLVGGAAKETHAHNELWPPEGLEVEGGYLMFMQENQVVVDWGIPQRFLKTPDPPVWQRVNGDTPKWYSQRMVFSVFIIKYLSWQQGVGGAA